MPCINLEKISFETVSDVFRILNTLDTDEIVVYAKCIRLADLITGPRSFSWKEMPGMSYTGRGDLQMLVAKNNNDPCIYSMVVIVKNGDRHYVYVEPTSFTDRVEIARVNEALNLCCNQLMHTHHPIDCAYMYEINSRQSFDDDDVKSESPTCVSDTLPMRKHSKCIDF